MWDIKTLEIFTDEIYDNVWLTKNITLALLRLDRIHPVISGNKLFKLHYFLQKAIKLNFKIVTFGGAYSNHLTATAAACRHYEIPCIGIVRGERPATLSPALLYCSQQNMKLLFISRNAYKQKVENTFRHDLQSKFGDHILIPEGGFDPDGIKGAATIYDYIPGDYTHICCAVGSGTTIAGLITAGRQQKIIGFSALKNVDFEKEMADVIANESFNNYHFINQYHFGGYAKKTGELINFLNTFYEKHAIALDFVYTGKMMYGVIDLIRQNYFPEGSRIICIHTGGLQGNSSLTSGALKY